MKSKFLDLDKIYNLHFNEKIVTPKYLLLQGFVIATSEFFFGRSTLVYGCPPNIRHFGPLLL